MNIFHLRKFSSCLCKKFLARILSNWRKIKILNVEILILIITLLANRLNLNSTNSSKPPSSDPNRKKQPKRKTCKKPGGQNGYAGTTFKKVDDPDKVKVIKVDRSSSYWCC
jgi:hypothetical protein